MGATGVVEAVCTRLEEGYRTIGFGPDYHLLAELVRAGSEAFERTNGGAGRRARPQTRGAP